MTLRRTHIQLGIIACLVAAFLILIGIPAWVSSPSNVRNLFLSPVLWPYTLSALTGLVGTCLILSGLRAGEAVLPDGDAPEDGRAWLRLLVLAALMVGTVILLPLLGMVWTSMFAFAAAAFLFRTRHPIVALICAVAIPLLLYAFFAKVAGVAIPQGAFVRLP
ncbi:MAG: tripartite tricarboxylate transporter TctB family protein [Jannaschia sp.]